MKGKQGHRPGSLNKHDQEGVADKTRTLAGGKARNRHAVGATYKSVGRFGNLNLRDGEGMTDKNKSLNHGKMRY